MADEELPVASRTPRTDQLKAKLGGDEFIKSLPDKPCAALTLALTLARLLEAEADNLERVRDAENLNYGDEVARLMFEVQRLGDAVKLATDQRAELESKLVASAAARAEQSRANDDLRRTLEATIRLRDFWHKTADEHAAGISRLKEALAFYERTSE